GFVAQLPVRLVARDVGGTAGGETAVRMEGESLSGDIRERLLDTPGDLLGRVDLLSPTIHAAQADAAVRRQVFEHREVSGRWDREFEHVLFDLEPSQMLEDRPVAAFAHPAGPGLVPPAEGNRGVQVVEAGQHVVQQFY